MHIKHYARRTHTHTLDIHQKINAHNIHSVAALTTHCIGHKSPTEKLISFYSNKMQNKRILQCNENFCWQRRTKWKIHAHTEREYDFSLFVAATAVAVAFAVECDSNCELFPKCNSFAGWLWRLLHQIGQTIKNTVTLELVRPLVSLSLFLCAILALVCIFFGIHL